MHMSQLLMHSIGANTVGCACIEMISIGHIVLQHDTLFMLTETLAKHIMGEYSQVVLLLACLHLFKVNVHKCQKKLGL